MNCDRCGVALVFVTRAQGETGTVYRHPEPDHCSLVDELRPWLGSKGADDEEIERTYAGPTLIPAHLKNVTGT